MGGIKTKLAGVLCAAVLAAPAAAATFTEDAKLTTSDGAQTDYFGCSVSVSGDTAVVGAYCDNDNGDHSGSAYVFVRSGSIWTEQAKLTASDGGPDHYFGRRVSVSGETAVVGAPYGDGAVSDSGSAYVFERSGGTWTERAEVFSGDGAAVDHFGRSVSVDGDTAVVAAYGDDDNGAQSGSAYVFVRSGSVWAEQAKLTASDGAVEDWFGFSISVSGDTAIVGALRDDDNGSMSGSTYVFDLSSLRPAGGGAGGCAAFGRRATAGDAMFLLAAAAVAFALGRRTPAGVDCVRDFFARFTFE